MSNKPCLLFFAFSIGRHAGDSRGGGRGRGAAVAAQFVAGKAQMKDLGFTNQLQGDSLTVIFCSL